MDFQLVQAFELLLLRWHHWKLHENHHNKFNYMGGFLYWMGTNHKNVCKIMNNTIRVLLGRTIKWGSSDFLHVEKCLRIMTLSTFSCKKMNTLKTVTNEAFILIIVSSIKRLTKIVFIMIIFWVYNVLSLRLHFLSIFIIYPQT